jgi:Mn-dependent DtxR family transcriptional regulator
MCPELAHGANADRDWPSACQCELIHTVREDIASKIDALLSDPKVARDLKDD